MNPAHISAVILAAGFSSRMGAFKPLLPINGTTLLERSIRLFRAAKINNIFVVTGHKREDLDPMVLEMGAKPIFNADFASGMLTSIQAGARAVDGCRAFFLMPVDIPLVRQRTISALLNAIETGGFRIYHPVFDDQEGHPVLFSSEMSELIINYQSTEGLHPLLKEYASNACQVKVFDEGILMDADSPEKLEQLKHFEKNSPHLTHNEWQALMKHFNVPDKTAAHCLKVAEIASTMGFALHCRGENLDIHLIEAAARVHDLAKGQKDHAVVGARLLRQMGMVSLAEIIARHTDMGAFPEGPVSEAEVVFLADKLVSGTARISITERFNQTTHRFKNNADALKAIAKRHEMTRHIQARIEKKLKTPISLALDKFSKIK